MGYIQTAVNVSEGVQVVQLTVAISMSPGETIETFFLRVNTSDRTATGLPLLKSFYLPTGIGLHIYASTNTAPN